MFSVFVVSAILPSRVYAHDEGLQMPQVLGESITSVVLSNTSSLKLSVTAYQFDASGKWNYKFSWSRAKGRTGSITINGNRFVDDASGEGENFTGFSLSPNTKYRIRYYSKINGRGSVVFSKYFTTAPAPVVTENYPVNTTPPYISQVSNLDLTKLPLGDNKYSSTAKQGYVFTCQSSFNGGGAFKQGPWINTTDKTWDSTKKITVDGSISWLNATWKVSADGSKRILTGNGLPVNHTTGNFPIASSDDAYSYDRNPNSIKSQNLSLSLPTNPTLASQPLCIGGEIGVMLSGVPLFSAFDAGGRDAVATEIQDSCAGHPQVTGFYHYHGLSNCLKDSSSARTHSELIGYAFDGFGIFGNKGEGGTVLTTKDLDACHGHSHEINWDGKKLVMYHYHMTLDFPYSAGCFMGNASVKGVSNEQGGGGLPLPGSGMGSSNGYGNPPPF